MDNRLKPYYYLWNKLPKVIQDAITIIVIGAILMQIIKACFLSIV